MKKNYLWIVPCHTGFNVKTIGTFSIFIENWVFYSKNSFDNTCFILEEYTPHLRSYINDVSHSIILVKFELQ